MVAMRRVAAVMIGLACSGVFGEVKLASVFTDHMVLQRDKDVRVWGTAQAGKKVTVKVGAKEASAKAGGDGKWMVKVGEQKGSQTPVELTASEDGGNTVTVSDVLMGDVWVCSGQSNMEFALQRAGNAAEAVPAATDQKIRLLTVPHKVSDQPLTEQAGKWVVCSPEAASKFTAVGYFFGKDVRAKEGVPVGLVETNWGGTLCEAWTPRPKLDDPEWEPLFERDRQQIAAYPKAKEAYEKQLKAYEEKVKANPKARKPAEPRGADSQHRPSVLWNGMVEPLVPMSITGVIWYQGESNAGRAEQYRSMFPNMIEGWRDAFKQGDVPFLFVQLANFGKTNGDTPDGSAWAELREAQAMTLKLKNTGMAVAIDVGNPNNIHPTDKQTVGHRLALAAEKVAYGHDVEWQGPTYKSVDVDGKTATVKFKHAEGLATKDGGEVNGFKVAGEDKKFVPAESAKVEGESVVVTAPASVGKIAAVRYGWADNPETSLYNKAGLPMVPFRTDDWTMVTAGKK